MKKYKGFTLIEVMVVVGIIAIITTIAWPIYLEQGRSSNRTNAIVATSAVALALTQFASDNSLGFVWSSPPGAVTAANAHNRYLPLVVVGAASDGSTNDNTCTQQRGFRWVPANARYESCRGLYSITVAITPDPADATIGIAYTITTTAIAGLAQSRDLECNSFTLDNNGVKGHIAYDGIPAEADGPVAMQAGPTTDGQFHSTKRCWGSS